MSYKKPFYSKRRLKKMGIEFLKTEDKICYNITSLGGKIRHANNIFRMLKNTNKQIEIRIDGMVGSCGTWIK